MATPQCSLNVKTANYWQATSNDKARLIQMGGMHLAGASMAPSKYSALRVHSDGALLCDDTPRDAVSAAMQDWAVQRQTTEAQRVLLVML